MSQNGMIEYLESDEDSFHDALEYIQQNSFVMSSHMSNAKVKRSQDPYDAGGEETKGVQEDNDEDEPEERSELPWLKDPSVKVSFWAIFKDSIGKDISKLSAPVYFNDPTSLLQKCAQSMEYNSLLV